MKKSIKQAEALLSEFESSEVSNLATIFGGTEPEPTTSTSGYVTKSTAEDTDSGDHDEDY